ncbi:MAG: hypothetical protein C0482_05145 [Gordonia sp.]|nr:hypothetical protein [Gordonia sp. (in: high G+C Gram-positive bacteria)]
MPAPHSRTTPPSSIVSSCRPRSPARHVVALWTRRRKLRTPDDDLPTEPDYRFTLANERTFLAWIRTAMTLLAASIVLGEFFRSADGHTNQIALRIISITCVLTATTLALNAYFRWDRVQHAMSRSQPLPRPANLMRITVASLCLIAVICIVVAART